MPAPSITLQCSSCGDVTARLCDLLAIDDAFALFVPSDLVPLKYAVKEL